MRKISVAVLSIGFLLGTSSAQAAITYINLIGSATIYSNGCCSTSPSNPSTALPFVATVQYDASLFSFYQSSYLNYRSFGLQPKYDPLNPYSSGTFNGAKVTVTTPLGSSSEALTSIQGGYSTSGGADATVFYPAIPPTSYNFSLGFNSRSYGFNFYTATASPQPFTTQGFGWLPSSTEPAPVSVAGQPIELQANMYFNQPPGSGPYVVTQINSFSVGSTVSAVPEPTSISMLAVGLGLAGFAARRKAKKDLIV